MDRIEEMRTRVQLLEHTVDNVSNKHGRLFYELTCCRG